MYTFKPGAWSSHSLLLSALPASGDGRSVLDVGCGPGYLGDLLARRGFAVTGLERAGGYDPAAFPAAVELVEADLEAGLPTLPRRYDYILCADILEHLRRPEDLLRQLAGVLTPGGIIVASVPNSGNIWFRLNVLFGRFPQDDKGLFDRTHLRFYMWKGWVELFASAGLETTLLQSTAIPVSLVVPPRYADSAAVQLAERVFYGMARMRKELFAYQFVVSARPVVKP